jgi:hypothetical protein
MTKSSVVRPVPGRRRTATRKQILAAGLSFGNYAFEFAPPRTLWPLHCRKVGIDPATGASLA